MRTLLLTVLLVSSLLAPCAAQSIVRLERSADGRCSLTRNGRLYQIQGAGGTTHLAKLAAAGGNSIRTWDTRNLAAILEAAHQHGLTVTVGFWIGHQRHGFDYQNQTAVLKQLDAALAVVREYKDHPAVLLWAVGNEMEGHGTDPSVWYAVNHIAREIKQIDPNHPTMTVIAELGESAAKVRSLERFCPDIDIIGINAYGGIESVGQRFREGKSSKPYIVTEHGPLGPWEVGKTAWGSPLERTSTQKAKFFRSGYQKAVREQPGTCLGSYVFYWGHKQETTATWFGMLLPDGVRTEAVDVMSQAWTGKPPVNRCPQIQSIQLIGSSGRVEPGAKVTATVAASDPEGDELTMEWVLRTDAGTVGEGGDIQQEEREIASGVKARGNEVTVTMPTGGGGYRLFVYVYDGQGGAATGNLPLNVAAPIALKSKMSPVPLPYAVYADDAPPSVYAASGYAGNHAAVSMKLDCHDEPRSGANCIKAEYNSPASWGGVFWQSPAEDWDGLQPGGANLTGASHLEFWARGARGNEVVNFVFGVLDGTQPYPDTAKGEMKDVRLTGEWKRYQFPLEGLDLRQIKTGFGWSLAGQGDPVVFYLDDIRFVQLGE